MMMGLAFAVGGREGDWSLVVPRSVVDIYGEEAGVELVKQWEKLSMAAEGVFANLALDASSFDIRVLDRSNGTLLKLGRCNVFRNWSIEKLRASFGREHRLETEKGLDVLLTFLNRNAFCTINRPSGKGKFLVIERGLIERMLDHWILGELLARYTLARVFGKTIDELNEEELEIVKVACEAESKAWKGRGRWDFAALGIVIALSGGSRRELVVELLRGMEAELWGRCRVTTPKTLVSKILKEASKEERDLLLLEDLFKFGEGAWITTLGCKRLGLDSKSVFADGGANLSLAVSWRSLTRRYAQDDRPIFIPLSNEISAGNTNLE
ncbi:hypothetical protein CBR_g37080 [Chara braunii]|uniref:Uncharacterized protein n=1 Tax=Chara braunii TaxID=69332 RepID=A0A388LM11_CHABU|nr:hypothetical protein CBR_g37080 [Chara braunii]|eukprot:GBG83366.1 hypothetical protein CBR_g37080 [Chara braunii]